MRRSSILGMLGALPVLLLAAACGNDDDPSVGGSGGGGSEAAGLEDVVVLEGDRIEVTAIDNTFRDQNIQISAGATVVWENDGAQDHNILPSGENGWGVDEEEFEPGDSYEWTFSQPGVYQYYCSLHGTEDAGMIGAVVVE